MRRVIDRRFDGSPGRRTRDYHLYGSSDEDESEEDGSDDECPGFTLEGRKMQNYLLYGSDEE